MVIDSLALFKTAVVAKSMASTPARDIVICPAEAIFLNVMVARLLAAAGRTIVKPAARLHKVN